MRFTYNLSAYVFRVLGALALLWVVRMLWHRQSTATLLMALLFLIYPGFLSQPNCIYLCKRSISSMPGLSTKVIETINSLYYPK